MNDLEDPNAGDGEFVAAQGVMQEETVHDEEGFTASDIELLKYAINFTKTNLDHDCAEELGMSCDEIELQLDALRKKLGDE